MSLQNTTYFFLSGIAIVTVLVLGKAILIPFVFALFLWFAVRGLRGYMDKVETIRTKFPQWLKTLVASLFVLVVLGLISSLISSSIQNLAGSYKDYESNVEGLFRSANEATSIDLMDTWERHSGDLDFGKTLNMMFSSLTDIFSSAFMILIYALFIFIEEAYFRIKLRKIIPDNDRYKRVTDIIERIANSISEYLKIKTLMSLLTGVLSYIALLLIGVESPEFWAFLIFLLNYIPTIGSLIATIFPAVFSLLQFGEFMPGLIVLAAVGGIQIVVGNILEPKFMGSSMNISALATILALSFWGAIWGVTGMIVSVPVTVMLIIICSHFQKTRPVAIILSAKGNVNSLSESR